MNLVETLCKRLNVRVGETWKGTDGKEYTLTKHEGLLVWESIFQDVGEWKRATSEDYRNLLTGKLPSVWRPKFGEEYYVPEPSFEDLYDYWVWENGELDNRHLKRGLVFEDKDEAISVANKMLEVLKEVN